MHTDVIELKDFYATPLGAVVRRLLGDRIRARWGAAPGCTVAGLGFATPYLGLFREDALRIGAFMPAGQGALVWPAAGAKLSVLVEEDCLPLPDNSVDRLLVAHCLEVAERGRPLLRELWRVLAPEGRMILIAPNRRGLWARFDTTPFGQGRPFSRGQLDRLLRNALFAPLEWGYALHLPPFDRPIVLRSAMAWERLGARLSPAFAGVIMVEASKQLAAPIGKAEVRRFGKLVAVRT